MMYAGRRGVAGLLAWSVLLAACSAVPDVVFVDADAASDAGAEATSDADASTTDAGSVVEPSETGCERESSEVCCGSSTCSKRECEGVGTGLRCGACALRCPGQRCCTDGPRVHCVAVDDECGE